MGSNISNLTRIVAGLIASLLIIGSAHADPSNKWRIQFSGKANSSGTIVLKISPVDGDAITAEIGIKNNTGENGVAKAVVKSLKVQLPEDRFHVERDDGEDVLIKKKRKTADFDLEIVSSSVEGVRMNPQKE